MPRTLVHTDLGHLFNNVRLKNTAAENARALQRKNTDCIIYATVNLGLELNDLVTVTDDHLEYTKKKLQVSAITETWDQGRLFQNINLYNPLAQSKVSLAAGEVTWQSQGVMWKAQTAPELERDDDPESRAELVNAGNADRQARDQFHPSYIVGGATTYADYLRFEANGNVSLSFRRDLPPSEYHRITLSAATSGTEVRLSWNRFRFSRSRGDGGDADAGFRIEYKTPDTDWQELAGTSGAAGEFSYTHTGLTPRTPYSYRVQAFTPSNEPGPRSNEVTVTPTGDTVPYGVQELTTEAKNNFGLAIFLTGGRTFKWVGSTLFPSSPTLPYNWSATAVAAAGTPNTKELRELIAETPHVVSVIVDLNDPHIDWENLQWCPTSLVEAEIAASALPPKITSLTATPI